MTLSNKDHPPLSEVERLMGVAVRMSEKYAPLLSTLLESDLPEEFFAAKNSLWVLNPSRMSDTL